MPIMSKPDMTTTLDEMDEYRREVEALVARCLEELARFPLPPESEPLTAWVPADE